MRSAVAFVALLLLTSAATAGGALAQESPEIDGPSATTFDVYLEADGDAQWLVRMTYTLDTEEERDAFRSYAEEFEDGTTTAGPSAEFFRAAAASASKVAGREMRIVDVTRNYTLGENRGTLELSFLWTAFLGQEGSSYVLRDALKTPDGTWLDSLKKGQEIRLHTPPGYDIVRSIEARQENQSLVITGPETFDPEDFVVAYDPSGTQTQSETPTPTPDWGVVATGLLGLLLMVVLLFALWRWRSTEPILADESDGSAEAAGTGQAATANGAGAAAAESDGEAVPEESQENGKAGIDPELLSDEERVEYLVEQNGGRMRQADIVSETDWSDAKVSQLLSRMAEEGRVEKLRLGRENVISLPDGENSEE